MCLAQGRNGDLDLPALRPEPLFKRILKFFPSIRYFAYLVDLGHLNLKFLNLNKQGFLILSHCCFSLSL